MAEYKLIEEILKMSNATSWEYAKLEWFLLEVIESEEFETCLCGHYPIKELCELKNKKNGQVTIVGNCCVKKFMGISSDKIFTSIKNIRKDIHKSVNIETLHFLHTKGLITDWEIEFYSDIIRKRKLTEKQKIKKLEINSKVLSVVKKSGYIQNN